jgi:hypothetical protein
MTHTTNTHGELDYQRFPRPQPGDVIVLRTDALRSADIATLRRTAEEKFPGLTVVIVAGATTFDIVRQPLVARVRSALRKRRSPR